MPKGLEVRQGLVVRRGVLRGGWARDVAVIAGVLSLVVTGGVVTTAAPAAADPAPTTVTAGAEPTVIPVADTDTDTDGDAEPDPAVSRIDTVITGEGGRVTAIVYSASMRKMIPIEMLRP